jgi:hypothetical protein
LLCCASASRDAYSPLLVAPGPNVARIFEKCVRENIDLKLEIRQTAYVDARILNVGIQDVFLPTIAANLELPGCANKPALRFCDNCTSHCSEETLRELARNGELLLIYPPHTSHIFQVFDVLLFGRVKALKKYLPKYNDEDRETDHVLRVFRACEGSQQV